jgi:peptidoglycan hydrolase-like protein with peptidoglycan-binding domain
MDIRLEQQRLKAVGFPIVVDGKKGPKTLEAREDFRNAQGVVVRRSWRAYRRRLAWCANNGGKVSRRYPHLTYGEMKSKGNGWIKLEHKLVKAFHKVRSEVGPVMVVSGYRDPYYNAQIGGAANSQHIYGKAVDIKVPLTVARSVALINGIGICDDAVPRACHIDVRDGERVEWQY